MLKTKFVCTIGPASDAPGVLQSMLDLGFDVARLNMSHGGHEENGRRLELLHNLRGQKGIPLALMLDTRGPEIRLGCFEGSRVSLVKDQPFTLRLTDCMGDAHQAFVNYPCLSEDVAPGAQILLDDGLIALRVESIDRDAIHCRVINGGEVSDHKGVNVPGITLSLPAITDQDIEDIRFGIQHHIDIIACSFIRTAQDIHAVRELLAQYQANHIAVYAKIESAASLPNIDQIVQAADGVMIARGDLGVEIPIEQIPITQKSIIRQCRKAGKPVIVATQMLDSMIRNPRPTRAEVNDVANAILDGVDAVMLSGETAAGRYPLAALEMMHHIARETEPAIEHSAIPVSCQGQIADMRITGAVTHACCDMAVTLDAKAIITPTYGGSAAYSVARNRPACQLIATTSNPSVFHQLSAVWGVYPILVTRSKDTDHMIIDAIQAGKQAGLLSAGDIVIISAGVPVGVSGKTNLIKAQLVE